MGLFDVGRTERPVPRCGCNVASQPKEIRVSINLTWDLGSRIIQSSDTAWDQAGIFVSGPHKLYWLAHSHMQGEERVCYFKIYSINQSRVVTQDLVPHMCNMAKWRHKEARLVSVLNNFRHGQKAAPERRNGPCLTSYAQCCSWSICGRSSRRSRTKCRTDTKAG